MNDLVDRNLFAVITAEHQIKVIALPNLITVHKYAITEGTVAKASVVVLNSKSIQQQKIYFFNFFKKTYLKKKIS